jgi:hypothetical protein
MIIFGFILVYLNDLKLGVQKKWKLQLIVINNDLISNDDDVAWHVSTRCYN